MSETIAYRAPWASLEPLGPCAAIMGGPKRGR